MRRGRDTRRTARGGGDGIEGGREGEVEQRVHIQQALLFVAGDQRPADVGNVPSAPSEHTGGARVDVALRGQAQDVGEVMRNDVLQDDV